MKIIKLITKLFTSPDKIDESKVEVVIELPPKTKQELFDDAVAKVVREKLHSAILNNLIGACYSPEERADTDKATAEYGTGVLDDTTYTELKAKYPKCTLYCSYRNYYIGKGFDVDDFITNLLDAALKEEEDD